MPESTLSPDRWHQVQALFQAALEKPIDQRADFLLQSCGDDSELRGAVASLLAAHERRVLGVGPLDSASLQEIITAALAGRYAIEKPIGCGGMATVFVASDLRHRRKVAIKVMRPELSLGVERFLREIEIAAGLQHPHILPLFDSGAADGLLYYVMPLVEGKTLATRMQEEGVLPIADTLRIARDVLGALDYAHRRGVVHRDIKPSNILLSTETGHALVADFGIARAISSAESEDLTAPGVAIGTPGYMPPEQARGETVTSATDVFATALVLHECLTGHPYVGEGTGRTQWAGVPAGMRRALQRALREAPNERWRDAEEFRKALVDGNERMVAPMWRWVSAVAVVSVLIVVFLWRGMGTQTSAGAGSGPERLAVLPFTVSGGSELAYLGEGMVDLLSTKLDGAGTWRTVDPRAVLSAVGRSGMSASVDPAVARSVARELGAPSFVLGNIIEVGQRIRIDVSLYGPGSDERIGAATAEGNASEVLDLLDRMTADLLSTQLAQGNARLTQIAAVTSQSLPALKSYLRGVRSLRLGEFPTAAAAFQEAISLDSTFALAWYQLSITADWLLRSDIALEAADRAVLFSDRLSERDRRLLEALQAIRSGDFSEAESRYRAIVGTYPGDIEAWSQLGELLLHFGPRNGSELEASREAWNRLIALEPDQATGYIHLARIEASRGDWAALDRVSSRALELAPEGDRGLEMRMFRAFVGDDARAQGRILGDLQRATEDLIGEVVWSAGTFITDPEAVLSVLGTATAGGRSAELKALAYGTMAFVHAGNGRWQAATAALDSMTIFDASGSLEYRGYLQIVKGVMGDTVGLRDLRRDLLASDPSDVSPSANRAVWFSAADGSHKSFRYYLIALASVLLDDGQLASVYRDSLSQSPVPRGTGSIIADQVRAIDAMLAAHDGSIAQAEGLVDENAYDVWHQIATASPFFNQGLERFFSATILEQAGRPEEAKVWYASVFDTNVHDRVLWAPARLRLGQINEAMGDPDSARREYREVIGLLANPEAPYAAILEEATAALARLGS